MYELYVRSGGKTGETFFKNTIKYGESQTTYEKSVIGCTVYETLYLAVEDGLARIEEPSDVCVYSNNQAFIQGISNNQSLFSEDKAELLKLIEKHNVTFSYQKMEKIKYDSIMTREIHAIGDKACFASAEEWSHNRMINMKCACSLIDFYKKSEHHYSDYLNLKTYGSDAWSSVTADIFKSKCTKSYMEAEKYLPEPDKAASALRWYQRGLSLTDSIRKVLIEMDDETVIERKKETYEQLSFF